LPVSAFDQGETGWEIEGRPGVKVLEAISRRPSIQGSNGVRRGCGRTLRQGLSTGRPQSTSSDQMRGTRFKGRESAETEWNGLWKPIPCFYFRLTRSSSRDEGVLLINESMGARSRDTEEIVAKPSLFFSASVLVSFLCDGKTGRRFQFIWVWSKREDEPGEKRRADMQAAVALSQDLCVECVEWPDVCLV